MIERNLGELSVYDTPEALAEALADAFIECVRASIQLRGVAFVALAGGTTPKSAYGLLARPPRRSRVGWEHLMAYFGDERCVAPTSDDSNYKMASDALLAHVPIPAINVRRMRGEADPEQAACEYAALLRATMGDEPRFDLVMLGMGPDGHTASLFPGTDPSTDADHLVRAPYVEKFGSYRLTLTPAVINGARDVLIATEGSQKAPALHAVLRGAYDPIVYPVQIVSPCSGRLRWFADRAAAATL